MFRFELYKHIHITIGSKPIRQNGAKPSKLSDVPLFTKCGNRIRINLDGQIHNCTYFTFTHCLLAAASSTASSTFWQARPSSKVGYVTFFLPSCVMNS